MNTDKTNAYNLDTIACHADTFAPDRGSEMASRPLTYPIYQSSVFIFDQLEDVDEVLEKRLPGYMYTRYGNPNLTHLERTIAALEGADDALCASSGLGAIFCAVATAVRTGDCIIASESLYGGTVTLLRKNLAEFGVRSVFVDTGNLEAVAEALEKEKARLLIAETIANPTMRVADIPALAGIAHERNAKLVVDNTFASPYLLRPLELGADVVVESLSKYLNGHGDVIGGAIASSQEFIDEARQKLIHFGPSLDPFAAWLTLRGIRTLGVRMRTHSENALSIADFLSKRREVTAVLYPGLPSHPDNAIAKRLLRRGFGGMLSFEVAGGLEGASRFIDSTRLIKFAPSLADVTTTLTHPAKTSHRAMSPEERAGRGITDGLIRLSVGLENQQDIIAELERALDKIPAVHS